MILGMPLRQMTAWIPAGRFGMGLFGHRTVSKRSAGIQAVIGPKGVPKPVTSSNSKTEARRHVNNLPEQKHILNKLRGLWDTLQGECLHD